MEEQSTTTPVEKTPIDIKEVKDTISDKEQIEEDSKSQIDKKIPSSIPYNRFVEVNQKYRNALSQIDELQKQIGEIQSIKEDMEHWQRFSEENPEFIEKIQDLYQQQFIPKEEVVENVDKLSQLETEFRKFREQIEIDKIKRDISTKLDEVQKVLDKENLPYTKTDILQIMDKENIASPELALTILIGRNIDKLKEKWNISQQQTHATIPPGTPSLEGIKGILQSKRPSSFDEAVEMALKSGMTLIK